MPPHPNHHHNAANYALVVTVHCQFQTQAQHNPTHLQNPSQRHHRFFPPPPPSSPPNESPPAIYLFPPSPSSPAVTLSQLQSTNLLDYKATPLLLIVFDATWKHAKEMVSASEGVLKDLVQRVCLDGVDENVVGGVFMTMSWGFDWGLGEMVRLQAGFLKPSKPRPKMLKKTKHKEDNQNKLVDDLAG
ncbi:N-terminal glutamine amidohydrolase isoform 1 [Hibiscus syriacus]|uniref:N-terminal glutamine amidohydrolase isoform 1 n=1 Tax=Hibiscus syriacus TaxID=106335 RepID=A0A6A2ZYU2_HIBSY|nr:N-terminal glutamine amidohydrolase isoform 1 [Hibiscus syriacus]